MTRRVLVGVLLLSVAVACSDGATREVSTSTAPPATTSTSTTAATVSSTTAPAETLGEDVEVWDLVYVSDSTGWGVANKYAARIQNDLGVQVEVHDLWAGGLPLLNVLEALRGERILRTWFSGAVDLVPFIEEAEVIVVAGNPTRSETADYPFDMNCALGLETNPVCRESTACGPETWTQYETDLAAVFDEIFAIRSGEPVILRTKDMYLPWGPLQTWRECGHEQVCKTCFSNMSDAIHRVADRYGIPVAGQMRAFSGPNLDQDMPRDYIKDDVHPSDEGAMALASVLADLGYEPVVP